MRYHGALFPARRQSGLISLPWLLFTLMPNYGTGTVLPNRVHYVGQATHLSTALVSMSFKEGS